MQGWYVYHLDHVGLPFVSLSISHVHESMTCPMRALPGSFVDRFASFAPVTAMERLNSELLARGYLGSK